MSYGVINYPSNGLLKMTTVHIPVLWLEVVGSKNLHFCVEGRYS
jgi:hypothetical protein